MAEIQAVEQIRDPAGDFRVFGTLPAVNEGGTMTDLGVRLVRE